MPASKQIPLTAPRGRDVHDFKQSFLHWEATVFDNADHFNATMLRMGYKPSTTEFKTFLEAVEYARTTQGICLNAVTLGGRHALLDREKWDEWLQRWQQNQMENVT